VKSTSIINNIVVQYAMLSSSDSLSNSNIFQYQSFVSSFLLPNSWKKINGFQLVSVARIVVTIIITRANPEIIEMGGTSLRATMIRRAFIRSTTSKII